ncbi:DUF4097 family beta strand repeat-containing protein [Acetivibrio ethanolgignens]|uniref:DUF4097 domain-containing protein n=1 Tax=Acetivibrio ethanolgignens TaxID=290052 RepID=A0A0V8QGY1_9FIRM|nr:DUF4097 family beta strand repeat-containing protein [Acetivibrio ethanolgignens]KSV59724.1 hypothetical protein ASU35_08205 [Acetivibrio ethanolgignens]
MNTQQKFVKYLATTLAILLIAAIIGGIVTSVLFLTGVYSPDSHYQGHHSGILITDSFDSSNKNRGRYTATDFSDRELSFSGIQNIKLDASIYSVYLKKDDVNEIQVELHNVYNGYIVKQDGNTLILEEPNSFRNFSLNNLFDLLDNANKQRNASIHITVPQDFTAKEVELNGGVGNIELEKLAMEHLDIDAGVGDIKGFQVTASSADIDGGTGNIKFTSSAFGNAEIDSGVGNVIFSGTLQGHTSINCGVGNTELSLSDSRENYYLSLEKGLGTMTLNGNKIKFDDTYTENPGAPYSLEVSGGVGNITIDFADSF